MRADVNRRSFVREDDELPVRLRKLDALSHERIVSNLAQWRLNFSPAETLLPERSRMRATFRKIRAAQPDVAAYLSHLERRIETLSVSVGGHDASLGHAIPVNLSAQGLRCPTRESFALGDAVEIGMILLPDHVEIAAIGRVVRVEQAAEDGASVVSFNFDYIRDRDQDALIRHVNRLQRETLAMRREAG